MSAAALKLLESYAWPGNIRELRDAVERAMLLTGGVARCSQATSPCSARGGSRTRAGALLGLNRDQVRYRVEKYGLEVPSLNVDEG